MPMDNKLNTDNIYEILKNRIIQLEYDPGQILNEVDIAEEFGTSRTPIRRVFQLLQNDKLLNKLHASNLALKKQNKKRDGKPVWTTLPSFITEDI